MAVAPPGDPLGPQELTCIFCWPRRGDDGKLLRDADGNLIRNCGLCAARGSDRWCECTYCYWL